MKQPFFYDVTLRDGNQALKKPWNTEEKEIIFERLLALKVQAIEVGFANASDMDFEACRYLADKADNHTVISGLARVVPADIRKVADAVKNAPKPRIHTFVAMSPLSLEHVLKKPLSEIKKIASNAVAEARSLLPKHGEVQFSAEHFGDCSENLDEVIEALQDIVRAGADVINLPNTVERFHPMHFVRMVERVIRALPKETTIAVHCHNDLGMATATTVESYFSGAVQLECSLNGLGERTGNTNLYEVATALHNAGVNVPLALGTIYETALLVSEMSGIPIWEKAPIIGFDSLSHRSGIHQDGVTKTKGMNKGAYRAFNPKLVGRYDGEKIGFTNQSGKTALYELYNETPYKISLQEAVYLTPFAKALTEKKGELGYEQMVDLYLDEICSISGDFELKSFGETGENEYRLSFKHKKNEFDLTGSGNGPIAACIGMLRGQGFSMELINYEQHTMQTVRHESAQAMTVLHFNTGRGTLTVRAIDTSTLQANVKAIFNALNRMSF